MAGDGARTQELAILIGLGVVAALATSVAASFIRLPGHAILRGTLPLILGVSFVPRRTAGSVMSAAAAATFGALRLGGMGLPNPAAWVGLLCLGPAIDLATASATSGWKLYARFAAAGLLANLVAFAARMALGQAIVGAAVRIPGSGGGNGLGGGRGLGAGLRARRGRRTLLARRPRQLRPLRRHRRPRLRHDLVPRRAAPPAPAPAMIFVGIDDTDMPDTPGTNKLAFHLAERLAADYRTQWIVRHQLLEDPRVPCTNKNGCVSMLLEPLAGPHLPELIHGLRRAVIKWSPPGSDPGLCVTEAAPGEIVGWGRAAQTELLEQRDALRIAAEAGVHLEPLGGTGDGVIGALAAVGLLATGNSGRVVYCGAFPAGAFDATGCRDVTELYEWGVDEVLAIEDATRVTRGTVDLGKRLRPNLRDGRTVLYVARGAAGDPADWIAQRIVA